MRVSLLCIAIGIVQENKIEIRIVAKFQPTQFPVSNHRKLCIAIDAVLPAVRIAVTWYKFGP